MGTYRKLDLETCGQECGSGRNGTHVKDMKEPVEIQPPGRDSFFVALRVEKARNGISFPQLDGVPLDLRHSPTVKSTISKSDTIHTLAGSTHVVSCSIASNIDRLN